MCTIRLISYCTIIKVIQNDITERNLRRRGGVQIGHHHRQNQHEQEDDDYIFANFSGKPTRICVTNVFNENTVSLLFNWGYFGQYSISSAAGHIL